MTPSTISGLHYLADYLDPASHDRLLASVELHPWMWSADHRVQVYGYRYHHPTRSVFRIGELPPWASELALRLHRDCLLPRVADQLVVNDYDPGSGIFPHVDQEQWGEFVASVSLGSTCVMRFSKPGDERRDEIFLEPRSVLVLSGEARYDWEHEIPPRAVDTWEGTERPRGRRVSLTFRIVGGSK